MTHEDAQDRTLSHERVSLALPDATDPSEALVQQIAEALRDAYHAHLNVNFPPTDGWHDLARAVLPLVEAQVAPLRDEVEREVEHCEALGRRVEREVRAREAAESALRQVRELAEQWRTHARGTATKDCGASLLAVLDSARVGAADTHLNEFERLMQSADPDIKSEGGLLRVGTPNKASTDLGAADTQPEGAGAHPCCVHSMRVVSDPTFVMPYDTAPEVDEEDEFQQCPHEAIKATCGDPCGCDCGRAPCRTRAATPTAGGKVDTAPEADEHIDPDWETSPIIRPAAPSPAEGAGDCTCPDDFETEGDCAIHTKPHAWQQRDWGVEPNADADAQFKADNAAIREAQNAVDLTARVSPLTPTAGGKVDTAPEADEPCVCGTGFTCMARVHETGGE